MQIANNPSERWHCFVLAPVVNGNACFSVLAKPEDMLAQTSNEYVCVMKGNRCAEASLILTLGALPLGVVWEGRGRYRGQLQGPISLCISAGAIGLQRAPVPLVLPGNSWSSPEACGFGSIVYIMPVILQFSECHVSWTVSIDARPTFPRGSFLTCATL